jgi:hypothetical protein
MGEINYDKIIELAEMGLLSIAIFSLAIIKLMSYCNKKKVVREQMELLKSQADFNNKIEIHNRNEQEHTSFVQFDDISTTSSNSI